MLAIYDISTGYRALGVLHVLAAIAAFGPLLVYPSMKRAGADQAIAALHTRFVLPALVLVWVFGMGLVGMSNDAFEMTDAWIALSLAGWVILVVVNVFLVRPALVDRSETTRARLGAGVGITHLLMVVIVVLMIFKPGS